ncbi:hypothetical protein AA313_de0203856 [Arthrobotrys entomopaga]|nr:hypothetical protein AA313_de0203856 [Arthrobotrys entomopaga]
MKGWYEKYFGDLEDGCVDTAELHVQMAKVTVAVLLFQRDCRRSGRANSSTVKTQIAHIEASQGKARENLEKLKGVVETARQCLEEIRAVFENTD